MSLLDVILVVDIRMMVYDTILKVLLTIMMSLYYYNALCSIGDSPPQDAKRS